MMPEMDGFIVSKRLKSMSSPCDIPVIILAVREELKAKLRCFSFKADDQVVRPDAAVDLTRMKSATPAVLAELPATAGASAPPARDRLAAQIPL